MANIVVNDIKLAGAELFVDYETFINDLEDNELEIRGGLVVALCSSCHGCGAVAYA
ncbi:hypothetical protein [Nostoc sp. MG11]|uniref:hypothetical protein n=1 Tax=Nostoc sp. MG11 TaxID=2721166 RepID=UPI001868A98E|nr:hypothetical protein [Nostoc sp. MG11]